jgi:hypothetical protein
VIAVEESPSTSETTVRWVSLSIIIDVAGAGVYGCWLRRAQRWPHIQTVAAEWSTPADKKGIPEITGYEASIAPAGTTKWTQVTRTAASKRNHTFTRLAPGVYTVRVVAINDQGGGDPGYASVTVKTEAPAGKRTQTLAVRLPNRLVKSGKTMILSR